MMYNSAELLLTRKIARENKCMEEQERDDREEEKEIALFEKANQAYLIFKKGGSLLSKLDKTELQDIVRFFCSLEKTKGGAYSKHSVSMKKMRERIAMVHPVWTKYVAPPVEEEEEPTTNSTA